MSYQEAEELKEEYPGIEDLDGFDELCTHELDRVPDHLDLFSCRDCNLVMQIKVSAETQQAWDISFLEEDEIAGWLKGTGPKVCP
jgi:hypothetical protein